jgi:hypothetical protein
MAEPNAGFIPDSEIARTHGSKLAESANFKGLSQNMDPELYEPPRRFVYVYSVVDPRPTPLMRYLPPLVKNLRIPELKPGERYTLVTKISDPMLQPDYDVDSGQKKVHRHNGLKVAQDIVYPENVTLDQDFQLKPEHVYAEGNNYGHLGVFWSLNNPPTEEEISKAVARKERYYRALLEQARVLETSDPKRMNEVLSINHHCAADYFGEEFAWHRTAKKPMACDNCGEPIKPGVAFHRSTDGIICVLDWKRTVDAGVRKPEDVPESKRWWKEKVKA